METTEMKKRKKIRWTLAVFIILLLLSGITAFPVQTELGFLIHHLHGFPQTLQNWIRILNDYTLQTPSVLFYGTDWLAFAHIVIALFFIPVYLDPVKYKINLKIGIIACLGVFPIAFICGPIRGIPFFHQLIDCSFGAGGALLLYYILNQIKKLESQNEATG